MDDLVADRPVKVTMVLCDFAQVAPDGKLTLVGGFWTITGPGPASFFIAGAVEVPWTAAGQHHRFRLECVDLDGQPVMIDTPEGPAPLYVEGGFEAQRPEGIRAGSDQPIPFAIPVGPVQLPPGGRFEWRLTIDGRTREEWRLPFSTRAAAPPSTDGE